MLQLGRKTPGIRDLLAGLLDGVGGSWSHDFSQFAAGIIVAEVRSYLPWVASLVDL